MQVLKNIHVYTEANPNPQSMKFVANSMLLPEGVTFDFPDKESAKQSPLAYAIFERFEYVKRVFMMSNFVTLTKSESVEWQEAAFELRSFITEYLKDGKPLFQEILLKEYEQEFNKSQNTDPEIVKKIKGILDEYIRPAVESDGGAISFHSYQEDSGTVKVLLQGSCSGCPSSMITLKAGIENLLKRMLPEQVKEVVAQEG